MTRLSDEEVLEIIRRFQTGGYATEEENDEKYLLITSAYYGISNLIFHDRRNLSPEQILEEAKKIRPILLGPGPG